MSPKGTWRATLGQAAETPPEAGRPAALLMVHGERVRFGARDTIFVPAGTAHRFENFSGGFFYGPRGAEAA